MNPQTNAYPVDYANQQPHPGQQYPPQQFAPAPYNAYQQPVHPNAYAPNMGQPVYAPNPAPMHPYTAQPNIEKPISSNHNNVEDPLDEAPVFTLKDTNSRLKFVKKVYGILFAQLLLTVAVVASTMSIENYDIWVMNNFWTWIPVFIVELGCVYALVYSKTCARKVPLNFVLLGVVTLCVAYMVSFTVAFSPVDNVLIALGMTCLMTLGLTIYAMTTKTDITMCGGLLFVLLMVLVGGGLMGLFIQHKAFHIALSGFGAVLFSFYIIYDTQLIMGGKSHELSVDDYILGALNIYLDIINLFLEILRLLNKAN